MTKKALDILLEEGLVVDYKPPSLADVDFDGKVTDLGWEVFSWLLDFIRPPLTESDRFKEFATSVLRRINPKKPFGTELYNAVARLSWNIFFEAVALRFSKDIPEIEVYLRKRAHDDPFYPSEWHAPGSAFRPGDTERSVADRLAGEFGVPISEFTRVDEYVDWEKGEARGSGISRIYLVTLEGEPSHDERHGWFPIDQLPEVTVDCHRMGIIPRAVEAFKFENR